MRSGVLRARSSQPGRVHQECDYGCGEVMRLQDVEHHNSACEHQPMALRQRGTPPRVGDGGRLSGGEESLRRKPLPGTTPMVARAFIGHPLSLPKRTQSISNNQTMSMMVCSVGFRVLLTLGAGCEGPEYYMVSRK